MSTHPLEWAKDHPAATGLGIVAVGVVFLFLRGSGGGSSGDNGSAAAYYAANAAEAQSGNALEAVRINAAAQTQQTLIAADVSKSNNQTWASTNLAMTQSNNDTTLDAFPYLLASKKLDNDQLTISALGAAAQLPGATTTQVRHSGRVVNQDYHSNPTADAAVAQLGAMLSGQGGTAPAAWSSLVPGDQHLMMN